MTSGFVVFLRIFLLLLLLQQFDFVDILGVKGCLSVCVCVEKEDVCVVKKEKLVLYLVVFHHDDRRFFYLNFLTNILTI